MEEHSLIERFGLRSRLQFEPEKGQIWNDEARMVLVHAKGLGQLRRELVGQVGAARARSVFWRMGFECGRQDAKIAAKHLGKAEDFEVFSIGPALHAMEGVVHAHIVEADIDWQNGTFDGFVHWNNSWEAQAHLDEQLPVDEAYPGACWSACGYASGYTTEFFKRLVIFQETQCACGGHSHCVSVGKPAEAWEDQSLVEALWGIGAEGQVDIEEELRKLRAARHTAPPSAELRKPDHIVGSSPAFINAFRLLGKAAEGRISVLLLGETGVGKEVFARWLHDHSADASGPFVAINCSAIPAELVEAELFGVRRGAFTGAVETRKGRFERANGGTLFLDEVGELPLAVQAKLLRVLQTGEVERLGDDQVQKVNVRLISATNVDLAAAMRDGRFRSDLYYRLATYPISLPPLRDRVGDIPLLVKAMIARFAPVYGKVVPAISERAARALEAYAWPGNVRELENVIERAVLLATDGEDLGLEHLPTNLQQLVSVGADVESDPDAHRDLCDRLLEIGVDLEQHELLLMSRALAAANGNLSVAGTMLNLTRRQLAYRMQKLQMPSDESV